MGVEGLFKGVNRTMTAKITKSLFMQIRVVVKLKELWPKCEYGTVNLEVLNTLIAAFHPPVNNTKVNNKVDLK